MDYTIENVKRDPAAFIEALLADPEFQREIEEEDQRKWQTFTLRLLAWDGESEELPNLDRLDVRPSKGRSPRQCWNPGE